MHIDHCDCQKCPGNFVPFILENVAILFVCYCFSTGYQFFFCFTFAQIACLWTYTFIVFLQQRANGSGYPPASGQRRERPTSQPVNMRPQPVAQDPSKRVTFAGPQSTSGTSSGSCTDSSTESEADKRRTVYSITKYRWVAFFRNLL